MAGNSAWLLGDKLFRVPVGIFVSAFVARYLGPDAYGTLSFVFAYVAIFAAIATLGLDGVVVRELVKNELSKGKILGTAFLVKCISTLIAFLLCIFLGSSLNMEVEHLWTLVVIGSCLLLFQPADVIEFRFQSQLDGRAIVLARSSAFLGASAIKILLVVVGAPLALFAATPAMEAAMAAGLLVFLYCTNERYLRDWRFDRKLVSALVRNALPLALSGFFVMATMQIDKLILGSMSGNRAVGIYSAASVLSTLWYMVPVVLGASVAPTLTRLHENDRAAYRQRLQDVFSALTFIALCIGALTALFSDMLVGIIFGESFAGTALVLQIHIWTGLFVFHVSVRSRALLIDGQTKFVAIFAGLTLVADLMLNVVLIDRYAEIGAAWASLLSWGLCAMLFPLVSSHCRVYSRMFLNSFSPAYWIRGLT